MSAEQQPQPDPQRKTLDDRAKMSELERIRHSCAHVMATAILRLWPDAQFASGPPVENGFYYDVELSHRISPEDFATIEAEMKKEIKANNIFEKIVVTREQAVKDAQSGRLGGLAERRPRPSSNSELEPDSRGRADFLFQERRFHRSVRRAARDAHRQHRRVQAHHRGQRVLQGRREKPATPAHLRHRIQNRTALDEYFKMLEEAKRRDHRKIGQEMGLFAIEPNIPGRACRCGCRKVRRLSRNWKSWPRKPNSPPVTCASRRRIWRREKMYKTSGHLPYYAESMFPPMDMYGRS